MDRLEAVGLVANIGRRGNGGLRFDMPMGPIRRENAEPSGEISALTVGEMASISPDAMLMKTDENPAPAWVCDESAPSPSVMINRELRRLCTT